MRLTWIGFAVVAILTLSVAFGAEDNDEKTTAAGRTLFPRKQIRPRLIGRQPTTPADKNPDDDDDDDETTTTATTTTTTATTTTTKAAATTKRMKLKRNRNRKTTTKATVSGDDDDDIVAPTTTMTSRRKNRNRSTTKPAKSVAQSARSRTTTTTTASTTKRGRSNRRRTTTKQPDDATTATSRKNNNRRTRKPKVTTTTTATSTGKPKNNNRNNNNRRNNRLRKTTTNSPATTSGTTPAPSTTTTTILQTLPEIEFVPLPVSRRPSPPRTAPLPVGKHSPLPVADDLEAPLPGVPEGFSGAQPKLLGPVTFDPKTRKLKPLPVEGALLGGHERLLPAKAGSRMEELEVDSEEIGELSTKKRMEVAARKPEVIMNTQEVMMNKPELMMRKPEATMNKPETAVSKASTTKKIDEDSSESQPEATVPVMKNRKITNASQRPPINVPPKPIGPISLPPSSSRRRTVSNGGSNGGNRVKVDGDHNSARHVRPSSVDSSNTRGVQEPLSRGSANPSGKRPEVTPFPVWIDPKLRQEITKARPEAPKSQPERAKTRPIPVSTDRPSRVSFKAPTPTTKVPITSRRSTTTLRPPVDDDVSTEDMSDTMEMVTSPSRVTIPPRRFTPSSLLSQQVSANAKPSTTSPQEVDSEEVFDDDTMDAKMKPNVRPSLAFIPSNVKPEMNQNGNAKVTTSIPGLADAFIDDDAPTDLFSEIPRSTGGLPVDVQGPPMAAKMPTREQSAGSKLASSEESKMMPKEVTENSKAIPKGFEDFEPMSRKPFENRGTMSRDSSEDADFMIRGSSKDFEAMSRENMKKSTMAMNADGQQPSSSLQETPKRTTQSPLTHSWSFTADSSFASRGSPPQEGRSNPTPSVGLDNNVPNPPAAPRTNRPSLSFESPAFIIRKPVNIKQLPDQVEGSSINSNQQHPSTGQVPPSVPAVKLMAPPSTPVPQVNPLGETIEYEYYD